MKRKYYRVEVRDHTMNLLFVGEYPMKTDTARARILMHNKLMKKAEKEFWDVYKEIDVVTIEE